MEESGDWFDEFKAVDGVYFHLALVDCHGDVPHGQEINPEHDLFTADHAIFNPKSLQITGARPQNSHARFWGLPPRNNTLTS